MSGVTKSILRQTSLLCRIQSLNPSRQIVLPFSLSSSRFAEPKNSDSPLDEVNQEKINENRSFESVREYNDIDRVRQYSKWTLPSLPLAVHLSGFGKVIMVLGGLHKRFGDVPDTVPYVSSSSVDFLEERHSFLEIVFIKKPKIDFVHVVSSRLCSVQLFSPWSPLCEAKKHVTKANVSRTTSSKCIGVNLVFTNSSNSYTNLAGNRIGIHRPSTKWIRNLETRRHFTPFLFSGSNRRLVLFVKENVSFRCFFSRVRFLYQRHFS